MDRPRFLTRIDLKTLPAWGMFGTACVCALTLGMRWVTQETAPPAVVMLCPHCYSSVGFMILGTEIHLAAHILMGLLLMCTGLYGLVILVQCVRRNNRVAAAIEQARQTSLSPRQVRSLAGVRQPTEICVIDSREPLAFCYGLLRPRICLSTALIDRLDETELHAVVCHERHHQATFAPLRLFAADLVSKTLFFIPVMRELRDLMALDIELRADRYAVEQVGRPALASALYRLLSSPLTVEPQGVGIVGISATHARIAHLLGDQAIIQRVSRINLVLSAVEVMVWLICML